MAVPAGASRPGGPLRFITELPAIMPALRLCAAANNASAEAGMRGAIGEAVVVPLRASSSRKNSALRAACCGIGEFLLLDEGVFLQPFE